MTITIPLVAADGATSSITIPDPNVIGAQPTINVGQTSVLPSFDNGNGNLLVAQPITLTTGAALQSLSFYVQTVGGQLRLGLYSGATAPTTLITQSPAFTPVLGWNTISVTSPVLAPGQYWLTYLPQSNALGFLNTPTAQKSFFKTATFGSMPASFPAAPNTASVQWSFYGTFLPAGADTIPPSPPTGLAATATSATTAKVVWTASTDNIGVSGYKIFRDSIQVGSATASSFNDSGLANGTTYSYAVSALDAAGNTSVQSMALIYRQSYVAPPPPSGGGGTLPTGVTLQAIDGESMTDPLTMTNSYYSRNSFTQAHTNGWDDPSFFPVGLWIPPLGSQSDANRWIDLSLNTAFGITSPSSLALMRSNGFSLICATVDPPGGSMSNVGSETVGLLGADEDFDGSVAQIAAVANSIQDTRWWWLQNTWTVYAFGDIGGTPMPTVMITTHPTPNTSRRYFNIGSADTYWYIGGHEQVNGIGSMGSQGGLIYNLGRDTTADENARGCRYGDMIDIWRGWQSTGFPAPILQFVENGEPGDACTLASEYIRPPELNCAMWASIIHGARQLCYFNHTFCGPAESQDNFAQTYYQTIQAGNSISIYDQAKATNALIKTLAPVINSAFGVGYVTVSPQRYVFPTQNLVVTGGFDVMAKLYQGSFYIFAIYGGSETDTSISATFTTKDTGATSVTVVNESRSLSISSGVFSDTFADGNTVHIYKVNSPTHWGN